MRSRVASLDRFGRMIDKLTRWRLLIVLVTGLLLTLIEMVDHFEPENPNFFKADFWHRLPIYAVFLPLFTWVLLELLHRTERARREAKREMDLQAFLNRAMLTSAQWDDLVEAIVSFPGMIVPVDVSTLHIYSDTTGTFKLVNSWRAPGKAHTNLMALPTPDKCDTCCPTASLNEEGFRPCMNGKNPQTAPCHQYCASLMVQNHLLGVLSFSLPEGYRLAAEQKEVLDWSIPEITMALANARLHHSHNGNGPTKVAESAQIAQDLHDTLAQNIGYLRLKLDQLVINDPKEWNSERRDEFLHMRDAANEAYQQIRGTLATLNKLEQEDLVNRLRERAEMIRDRSGLEVRVVSMGEAQPVQAEVQRQVVYISREALNNIEKHAQADSALVRLTWEKNELLVEIADDGLGFDPSAVHLKDHLGLSIMSQRAQAIRGKLSIASSVGNGTHLILKVPI